MNQEKFELAIKSLSEVILTIQGDGDYQRAGELIAAQGVIGKTLQDDLDRLEDKKIPVDIVFEQGVEVLNLAPKQEAVDQ